MRRDRGDAEPALIVVLAIAIAVAVVVLVVRHDAGRSEEDWRRGCEQSGGIVRVAANDDTLLCMNINGTIIDRWDGQ